MTGPAPRPLPFAAPCDRCRTVATLWPFQDRQALCPACHPDHVACGQAAPERLRAAPAWVCPHHITYRREEEGT